MITSMGNLENVTGEVPLSNMFGYATALRSYTKGRGTYSMQFNRYEEVPRAVLEKLLKGSFDGRNS